ncbi:MAG: hypothetical protein GY940_43260 [bacterium]|nr:hypothetical protein [bacterium]
MARQAGNQDGNQNGNDNSKQENSHITPSTPGGDSPMRDHVIICNWTSKADVIVRQLHDESVKNKRHIIIITEHPGEVPQSTEKAYRGVMIVSGDPANKEILERASIQTAKTAVILADRKEAAHADSKSILIQLAIDSINPDVHTIVELVNASSEMYFKYTYVNELICLEQLAEKLLSQAALTPGLSDVYMNLLTQSLETNEIYLEELPQSFIDLTYREVEKKIVAIEEKDIILIGFATDAEKIVNGKTLLSSEGKKILNREVVINPKSSSNGNRSKSYRFKDGDSLFVISFEKPGLKQYFQGN